MRGSLSYFPVAVHHDQKQLTQERACSGLWLQKDKSPSWQNRHGSKLQARWQESEAGPSSTTPLKLEGGKLKWDETTNSQESSQWENIVPVTQLHLPVRSLIAP